MLGAALLLTGCSESENGTADSQAKERKVATRPTAASLEKFLVTYANSLINEESAQYLEFNSDYSQRIETVKSSFPESMWAEKLTGLKDAALEGLNEIKNDPGNIRSFESFFFGSEGAPTLKISEVREPQEGDRYWTAFAEINYQNRKGARVIYFKDNLGVRRIKKAVVKLTSSWTDTGWWRPNIEVIKETIEPFELPGLPGDTEIAQALTTTFLPEERRPSFAIVQRQSDKAMGFKNLGFELDPDPNYKGYYYLKVPAMWSEFAREGRAVATNAVILGLAKDPVAEVLYKKQNGKVWGIFYSIKWTTIPESFKIAQAVISAEIIKEAYQLNALHHEGGPIIGFVPVTWDAIELKWVYGYMRNPPKGRFASWDDRYITYEYPKTDDSPKFLGYGSKGFSGTPPPEFKWENTTAVYRNLWGQQSPQFRSEFSIEFAPSPGRKITGTYELQ